MQEEAQRGQASCLWLHSGVKSSPSSHCSTAVLAPSLAVQVPIGGSGSPECDCKRLDSPSCVIRSEPAPSSGLSHPGSSQNHPHIYLCASLVGHRPSHLATQAMASVSLLHGSRMHSDRLMAPSAFSCGAGQAGPRWLAVAG